jgi:hypothetical protein
MKKCILIFFSITVISGLVNAQADLTTAKNLSKSQRYEDADAMFYNNNQPMAIYTFTVV